MKKSVYILFVLLFSFVFQSFKRNDGQIQDHKVKTFNLFEGVNIKMIWVEPGVFIMGSPNDELGRMSEREKQQN